MEPETLIQLGARLKLKPATVVELTKNGYETMSDLELFRKSKQFQKNLAEVVSMHRDRLALEIELSRKTQKGQTSGNQKCTTNIPIQNERNESPTNTDTGTSSTTDNPSNALSLKRKRQLAGWTGESDLEWKPTKLAVNARDLPRPHMIAVSDSSLLEKSELSPTDLTMDQFFAGGLHMAVRLAKQGEGKFAKCLIEYLDYQEFLAKRRCCYSNLAVQQFDDEFRRKADSKAFALSDQQQRAIVGGHHFTADKRRTAGKPHDVTVAGIPKLISVCDLHATKYVYKMDCCHSWNEDNCSCTSKDCQLAHSCGICGGNHRISACLEGGL